MKLKSVKLTTIVALAAVGSCSVGHGLMDGLGSGLVYLGGGLALLLVFGFFD